MADEKPRSNPKQVDPPQVADLVESELSSLRLEHDDLRQQLQATQLQLKALLGKSQTSEQVVNHSKQVIEKLHSAKRAGGKYAWRITNKRFKDGKGNPVSHVIWSNARDAREAVADWKRRCAVTWDPSEGHDPYDAEPIVDAK